MSQAASHFTAQDLALIRRVLLDEFDNQEAVYEFFECDYGMVNLIVDEAEANESRLRFCDAVQQRLVAAAKQGAK